MSIDHRAEAEKHLATASRYLFAEPADIRIAEVATRIGQGHAVLARNEEQAATTADLKEALHSLRRRYNDTRSLVSTHIAQGLASREKDRWKAALELSKALDEAHNNVDDLVDARLSDDGWDPRSAYKTPASLTPADDPWAARDAAATAGTTGPWGPGVTREQAALSVVTLHIAEALLDGKSEEVRTWARGLAHELRRERIDLIDEIGQHMQRMALGRLDEEHPF